MPSAKPVEVIVEDENGRPKTMLQGRWSPEEHRMFVRSFEQHGRQWKLLAKVITTRTVLQIRTHAQKYFNKLSRAAKNGSTSPPSKASPARPRRLSAKSSTARQTKRGSGSTATSANGSSGRATTSTHTKKSTAPTSAAATHSANIAPPPRSVYPRSAGDNTATTEPFSTFDFANSMKLMDGISDIGASKFSNGDRSSGNRLFHFAGTTIAARKRKEEAGVDNSGGLAKRKRSASTAAISLQQNKRQLQTPWDDGHNFEMHEDFRFFTHGAREDDEDDDAPVRERVPHFSAFSTPEPRKFNPLVDISSPVSLTDFNDFFMRPAPGPKPPQFPDVDEHKLQDDEFPRGTQDFGHSVRARVWMDDAADAESGLAKLELDIQHLARITEDGSSHSALSFPGNLAANLWS